MSQENVEIVRGWIERWNGGERDFPDDEVHPDVQINSRFRPDPYRGRDGLRQWVQEIDEQFQEWRVVVDDWRDAGTRVVGLGHIHLRGHGSGIEFNQWVGWLVEVSEGKLLRVQFFVEPGEALEAAGLKE